MWLNWEIGSILCIGASGVPGIFARARSLGAQRLASVMMSIGAVIGIIPAFAVLAGVGEQSIRFRGPLPELSLHLCLDPLGAFFLVPIWLVGALGSIYGLGYWAQQRHPRSGRRLRFFYGIFVAAMGLVVLAADAILFLSAWEIMAVSAFFLINTEEHKKETRQAGWLYLVSTHISTLLLFALFALFHVATGSFEFHRLHAGQAALGLRFAIFLTALVAFGLKAGMMPLHFWLPGAHANAPSHISAILSGILLKVGVYGLLRTLTLLPTPQASWGSLVLILGTLSAILGVLFALGQHDLKRLLAYHSIENIGIIFMGLGLALLGEARGQPEWVVLGLAGCLLHVWNHALFKPLLFLSAGSVIHSSGTRLLDEMGGVGRWMPMTAFMFLLGAVAICGLPPLNGFISELWIYLGLFDTLKVSPIAALAAPALALAGALAIACFVKVFATVFLGLPRRHIHRAIGDAPPSMRVPMFILAGCCGAIGVFPFIVAVPLNTVIRFWSGGIGEAPKLNAFFSLTDITVVTLVLACILASIFLLCHKEGSRWNRKSVTWDCGYAQPNARMQYTASSFAQPLVRLFRGVLRPRTHEPTMASTFPPPPRFDSQVDDIVLEAMLEPMWRRFRRLLGWLRILQQGRTQTYLMYILVILSLLLFLTAPIKDVISEVAK